MTEILRLLILSVLLGLAHGQCFGPGDIAASVIVPLILAAVIAAVVFIALWKARMIGEYIIKNCSILKYCVLTFNNLPEQSLYMD